MTSEDIQRLQDQVYDAAGEVSRLRSRDQRARRQLQTQLDDLRDEAVYLKVKMRKEGSVNRTTTRGAGASCARRARRAGVAAARPGAAATATGTGTRHEQRIAAAVA